MVVVTARGQNKTLEWVLRSGQGVSVLCAQTHAASFSGDGPDIVLVSQREFSHIACENAAFIVRSGGCLPARIDCKNAVAIVDSSDHEVLGEVARRRLPALTCGLAGSDTLTLSSITADSAVVSLQRTVTAFDGTHVEPFELPVALPCRIDSFALLAGTAVFCMMGSRNPLSGSSVWTLPEKIGFALRN